MESLLLFLKVIKQQQEKTSITILNVTKENEKRLFT